MTSASMRDRILNHYPKATPMEQDNKRDWRNEPVNWMEMHPDYAARLIVMSAVMYYRYDDPIISDAEHDKLVHYLSDPALWITLTNMRKWQVGKIHELRASTTHCKVTTIAHASALGWYEMVKGVRLTVPEPAWKISNEHNVSYILAGEPIK